MRQWELEADDAGGRRDPDAVVQGVAGREAMSRRSLRWTAGAMAGS